MLSLKKRMLFPIIGSLVFLFTSCTDKPTEPVISKEQVVPKVVAETSSTPPQTHKKENDSILSVPDAAVLKRGKELLKEYDVEYNQIVRFPHEGFFYQSSGAYAITSLEEAREKYPDFPIPEKLGDFEFVDLTLDWQRTSNVFSDYVPAPKNKIEVLTNKKAPKQYYLCYKNDSTQFKIAMLPAYLEGDHENFEQIAASQIPWTSHPDAYLTINEAAEPIMLHSLLISPEPDEKYAYFIQKVSKVDCLDGDIVDLPISDISENDFSQEEALSIYNAVQEGFLAKSSK